MLTLLSLALLLAALALIGLPALRRRYVSAPFLARIRAVLPPMSDTERTAIEAGTVGWEAELFRGKPDFTTLLAEETPRLTADEQAFLDGPVETVCRMLDDWSITHERLDLPEPVWDHLKRHRFFGMIIPPAYGGLGFSPLAHSAVVQKVFSKSASAGVTVMVPNSLGPAELLLRYGTEDQRRHYLPRLARGDEIPCFALTSPLAGSDAGAMPDRGVVCEGDCEGRRTLGLRVTWDKRYITLAPVATVLGLAFRAFDPDRLLGDREDLGITCALIPVSTPGVEIGGRHFPLNAAFQNGPTRGKDVFIPLEWVIGGRAGIGQGWRMLMECLAAGRGISLPACATSAAQLAARATGAYARIRRQFRLPIGRFEAVEDVLARIAGLTWLADAGRRLTLSALMRGEHPSVASAILKYRLTEDMRRVLNDAMDVHGGRGICMGPRNYLARAYQCIPVTITVEGANLLTRGMIVFGQGAIRCHPWLREEMEAALDPDRERGMARFDRALMGHARYMLGNLARSLTSGLTNGRYAASPAHGALAPHARQIARLSAAFAFLADASLMLLGGSLKRREKLSGRFADALACLYLASAALKRFHDDGCPEADLPLAQWALTHCAEGCESALSGILDNYPLRGVAWLLRRIVMPLGRRCAAPSDRLGAQVAATLLTPSDTRDRLTGGIHLTDDPADPLGRLEHALFAVLRADDLERRLAERGERRSGTQSVEDWCAGLVARGLVTADEATHLLNADTAMRDAIAVDEFTPEALRGERAKEPALWNAREAAHG